MLVGKMNNMSMDSRGANSMTTSQNSSNSQNQSSGNQNFGSRDFNTQNSQNSQNFQNQNFQHQNQIFQQNTTHQQSPQNNKNQSFSPQSHNAPGQGQSQGQFQTHQPHQIANQNSNLTSNNSSDKINELDKSTSSVGNDALVLSSLSSPLSKLNRVPPMTKAVSYGSFPYSSNASASEKLRQRQSPTNNGMVQPVDEVGGSSVNNNYSLPKSHSIEDLNEGGNAEGQEAGCSLM